VDIHEYQAKELLAGFGVPVPKGGVAYSADQAVYRATEIGASRWVVKAQIHSGARGKAGGIKLCTSDLEVRQAAKELLGKMLVTTQTGPEGLPVHRLLVEEALPIERELYVGLVLDRRHERIVVVAHPHGGMEIEEIAQREPAAILREVVEPAVGMRAFQARELAFGLGLGPAQVSQAVAIILGAYRAFRDLDATTPCSGVPTWRSCGTPPRKTRGRPRQPSTGSTTWPWMATSAASSTAPGWRWPRWT